MRVGRLADTYAAHLERWLDGGAGGSPDEAYELGRRAMSDGLTATEMTELHHHALADMFERPVSRDPAGAIRSAGAFLFESLSPFEQAHRGVRESNTNLRRLNARLEDESKRIAHAIHAGAGQLLASVAIALEQVGRELPGDQRNRLAEVSVLLDEIHHELRRLSHELRPPLLDQLGLLPALRLLAEVVSGRSGVAVRVHGELPARPSPPIETAVYRVVQEALRNVVQHAGAKAAAVRVWTEPKRLCCSVHDAGRGFDAGAALRGGGERGLGLIGIRERLHDVGGSLHIDAAPGRGTDLSISIPTEE